MVRAKPKVPRSGEVDIQTLRELAATTKSESKRIDFKESFAPESQRDWCEIVKDVVAMANSGGGTILFGLKDNGQPSAFDITPVLTLDPAHVTDKVARYTGKQFPEIGVEQISRGSAKVGAILVGSASPPLVFSKPGTYAVDEKTQKTAFAQGTIYFRHGAKSEPGTTDDLRHAIDREINRVKSGWLSGIKKVVKAPTGSEFVVAGHSVTGKFPSSASGPGRIVSDPAAPGFRPEKGDEIWPHRQKDIIALVNKRLKGQIKISTHDMYCVKKVFSIEQKYPNFVYRPFTHGSVRYADAFVDWLVQQFEKDSGFFAKAREQYRKTTVAKSS